MLEKNFFLKCEVNETNKDVIRHTLCNALKIQYSPLDSFQVKKGGIELRGSVKEAQDSSGYNVQIIYDETLHNLSNIIFILSCIVGSLLFLVWFWKGISPWWGFLICEFLYYVVLVGVLAGWFKYKEIKRSKINSIGNALQDETNNSQFSTDQTNSQTNQDMETNMGQPEKTGWFSNLHFDSLSVLVITGIIGVIMMSPTGKDFIDTIRYNHPIVRVLEQMSKIKHYNQSDKDAVAALKEVDVSDCPMDFRVAFYNYVEAKDKLFREKDSFFHSALEVEKLEMQLQQCLDDLNDVARKYHAIEDKDKETDKDNKQ